MTQLPAPTHTKVLVTPSNFRAAISALRHSTEALAIDLETSTLKMFSEGARIAGCAIYDPAVKVAYYFTFNHALSQNLPISDLQVLIDSINHRPHVYHNAKFDFEFARRFSTGLRNPDHDTYIIVKLLDFNRDGGLKDITASYGYSQRHIEDLVDFKSGQTMCDLTAKAVLDYATDDVVYTWEVFTREHPFLEASPQYQIYLLEIACLPSTTETEENGFLIDRPFLTELGLTYGRLKESTQAEVYSAFREALACPSSGPCTRAGCSIKQRACEFPLHSSQKLQAMIFTHLAVPTDGLKRTKTGFSTDAETLQELARRHRYPWLAKLLDYKEAIKGQGMVETYLSSIMPDGRIHCNLLQVWVISGRFACSSPNLQQVPKSRRGQGAKVTGFRRAFIARPGFYLLSVDFAQIEYRVFAALANAKRLIEAFNSGLDAHRTTASLSWSVAYDLVTEDQRDKAKTTGFGLIYGQTVQGLAIKLGIPESHAQRIVDSFFAAIPEFPRYIQERHRFAIKHGGVYTQYGRWIPIPGVYSSNRYDRAKALRLSVNATIQGCQWGNASIWTLEEGLTTLAKAVGQTHTVGQGYHVHVWNGLGFVPAQVVYAGKKQRTVITFSDGHTIECSPEHKFLIANTRGNRYWRTAEELRFGDNPDRIVMAEPVPSSDPSDEDYGVFLGRLASDGTFPSVNTAVLFVAEHEVEILPELERIASLFGEVKVFTKDRSAEGRQPIYKVRIFSKNASYWKRDLVNGIPTDVKHSPALMRGFLRGLADGDGGISLDKRIDAGGVTITFGKDVNPNYITDVSIALRFFGIQSSVRRTGEGAWKIFVRQTSNEAFAQQIGFLNSAKTAKLENCANRSGLYRVASVRLTSEWIDMYDVVNSPDETYVSDGVITHNTSADILKIAVCKVHKAIKDAGYFDLIKPVLYVHDEMDFEVHESIPPTDAAALIQGAMEMPFGPLTLTTDAEWGPNWSDLTKIGAKPKPLSTVPTYDVTISTSTAERMGLADEIALLIKGCIAPDETGLSLALDVDGTTHALPDLYQPDLLTFLERIDPDRHCFKSPHLM